MKRPMVLLTISYILGIIGGRYFIDAGGAILLALSFAAVMTALVAAFCTKRYEWLIIVPFFVLGIYMVDRPNSFERFEGMEATVTGTVSDIYVTEYGTKYITVDAAEIAVKNGKYKYSEKVTVITRDERDLLFGQAITASGTAERLGFRRNPGGFSEELYYRTRGYGGKLVDCLIETGEIESTYIYFLRETAERVSKAFHGALPSDLAGIMDAVILGESGNLPQGIYDDFRKTGVAHILSISGFHLSVIAAAALKIFRHIGLRLRGGALAAIATLWVYCVFTGASVSTIRAALMLSVLMFGYLIYRTPDVYSSAALAALVILLKSPLFLWDAGFLLSFSAVLGIGFLTPVMYPLLKSLDFGRVKISLYTAATVSATLFTMPVCAYFFFSVSVIGVFANLLIVPLMSLLAGAGFLFAVFSSFAVSDIFASVIFVVLKYFVFMTELLAELPFSNVTVGRPALYNIAAYYAAVIAAALYIKRRGEGGLQYRRRAVAACTCAAFVIAAVNVYDTFRSRDFEIAFLDVGQGDAAVLHLPENIDIMIDGGGNVLKGIGDNTGVTVVCPYMWSAGKTKLDAVFLTHPDFDHTAGVIEVMQRMDVKRLFISDINFDDGLMDLVLKTAAENGVPITRIKSGYTAVLGSTRIDCIYPLYSGTPKNINNGSLTLKVSHADSTFLFTGDIEKGDESIILLTGADIKSDVLKVPHHGSNTSSTEAFIEAVSPSYAIVGVGKDNNFRHPSPEIVERYRELGIPLYGTAEFGALFITSDGEAVEIDTMRRREAERWSN